MSLYKVGDKSYNIPEDKVEEFLTAYPNAVLQEEAGKTQPQVTGAPVEETPAPATESKPGKSSSASRLIKYTVGDKEYKIPENLTEDFLKQFPDAEEQKLGMIDRIGDWFGGLKDDTLEAIDTSKTQAELTDAQALIADKLKEVGEVKVEDVMKLVELDEKGLKEGITDSEESLHSAYDSIEALAEAKATTTMGPMSLLPPAAQAFLGSMMLEPKGAMVSVVRSMSSMAKSEAAREGALKTGIPSAVGVGALTLETGPGAILTSLGALMSGMMAGANLTMETALTLNELVKDEVDGYDGLSKQKKAEALVDIFNDKDKYEKLLLRAEARGTTITAIDLATGKIGGGVVSKVTKGALKKGASKLAQGAAEIVVEEGIEKAGAYTGELLGQAAAGQELNFKDAAMEAIGGFEVVTRPAGAGFKGIRTIAKPSSYSIRGKEVSRQQMLKFINANDGIDLATAGATIEIDGDSDVKNLFLEKARKATVKTKISENITDDADRDKVAELELERQSLQNNKTRLAKQRLAEVNAEIDAIGEKYKPKRGRPTKETTEARTRLKAEADRLKRAYRQAGVAKTVSFAESVAEKYGFSVDSVDNTKDFKRKVAQLSAEKNVALPIELLKKIERVGGTVVGGTIVINKEVAARTKQFNVGAHEVLHPIVNAKLYSLENAAEIIEELKTNFSDKQLKAIESELDRREYTDPNTRAREYLTVMSDMMNTKDSTGKAILDFDENKKAFEKLGQWLMDKIFRPLGFGDQAGFADGKQVYQFMREYQKSIAQGELTKATEKAIGKIDIKELGSQFEMSKQAKTDIDALAAGQTKAEWDTSGSNMAIADLYADGVLDALMGSKITQEMRTLPGFSEEDFISAGVAELIQHIRNFNPESNDSLNGWIMSQVANKAKTVLKKQAAATKATFAEQIDEGKVSQQVDDFDQYDEIGFDMDMMDEEGNLINPLDFLDSAELLPYRQAIKDALDGVKKVDELTFKKLNDLVPELTALVTGIPVEKLVNPKTNITSGQASNMQDFIIKHADTLIKLLPEGAVLEAASEKLIGTGTGLPKNLLNAFYNKNERLTKGAGLSPFEKKENISKADFFEPFGIKPDGTKIPLGGQDKRAQTIFAMARLIGKLMTNTAVRQELENQQVSRNTIVDVGAGRSEFMLSAAAAEDNYINLQEDEQDTKTYAVLHNETISKNRLRLRDLGLTDAQIDELEGESIKHTIKPVTNQKQWTKDAIVENNRFTKELMSYVPVSLKVRGFQTVFSSMAGNHTIYNGYGVNFNKNKKYSVYDENGKRLTNKEVKALQFTFSDTYGIETGKGSYPQYLIDAINEFENAYYQKDKKGNFRLNKKGEKVPKPGVKNFLTKVNTRNLKREYIEFNEQEAVDASKNLFNPEQDAIRVLYNKAVALSFQSYFESLKTPEQKLAALKQFKKVYSSSAITDGFKASVKLGGIVFDNRGKDAKYHFEHVLSAADMYSEMFENLITGKTSFKTPEAWLIPRDTAVAFDKTYLKTADRNTFITELVKESNKQGRRVITPDSDNFQMSVAPIMEDMVENSLNEMVSEKLNVDEKSNISEFQARRLGKNKGRFKFFIPPSADDFMGLMYYLARKGRQGDLDLQFIKETFIQPFAKAQRQYEEYRMSTLKAYRKLKKNIRNTPANLKKEAVNGFTNEQALRVYMWSNLGYEIPGISEQEISDVRKYVNENKNLLEFSKQIQNMLIASFPEPSENWSAGSLTIDILEHINETARKEFFAEFNSIAEETFGKMNNRGEITGPLANKLRAAFGDNYVEALSDVLYRMKVGRSRQFGRNRLVNQLENYINGSIATIMFFNTRSAILQMVSFVNFINFSDNNPIAAAQAYADVPQLSKDIMELMNSDYLVARRNGLKIDVSADDIAKSAESTTNKAGAMLSTILKAGYLPTQYADSFAIAFGGAPFYRNRMKTYMREGLSETEAKEKAYTDWKENAEESQQSSRPDKISQQQASTLGRLILAFGNTPMQYARITKKAALDLLAGRGDFKTNMSKLLYYGVVQNIMFTGLQQALFSLWLDDEPGDDEEEVEKYINVVDSAIDGFGRGLGYGGAIAVMVKNVIQEAMDEYGEGGRKNFQDVILEIGTLSPAISSKISRLEQGARTFTWKQELEKVRTEGLSLDNPAFEATGKFVSAITNVPLDRAIRKMDNISYPMRHEVQTWQAIALALGWGKWELGLIEVNKQEKNKKEKFGFRKPKPRKTLRK